MLRETGVLTTTVENKLTDGDRNKESLKGQKDRQTENHFREDLREREKFEMMIVIEGQSNASQAGCCCCCCC